MCENKREKESERTRKRKKVREQEREREREDRREWINESVRVCVCNRELEYD